VFWCVRMVSMVKLFSLSVVWSRLVEGLRHAEFELIERAAPETAR
jgi:hypothetical protein